VRRWKERKREEEATRVYESACWIKCKSTYGMRVCFEMSDRFKSECVNNTHHTGHIFCGGEG
jgi:hypothetical protein